MTFNTIRGNTLITHSFNMTVKGHAELTTVHSITYLSLSGSNQWLEIPAKNLPCSASETCTSGFTFQVGIMAQNTSSVDKLVLLTNGNDTSSTMSLFYEAGQLHVRIVREQKMWMMNVPFTMTLSKLNTYQLSWSIKEGVSLYVNNVLLGAQQIPVVMPGLHTSHQTIHIGKTQGTLLVTNIHTWSATRMVLAQRGLLTSNFPVLCDASVWYVLYM